MCQRAFGAEAVLQGYVYCTERVLVLRPSREPVLALILSLTNTLIRPLTTPASPSPYWFLGPRTRAAKSGSLDRYG